MLTVTEIADEVAKVLDLRTPPRIGEYWPGQGGIYVGLAAADGDLPQGHLVLSQTTCEDELNWLDAANWAASQAADGHRDFRLPTRFESALIYANARQHVHTDNWYWTSTEYEDNTDYAWYQNFGNGSQYRTLKDNEGLAVAVRRLTA